MSYLGNVHLRRGAILAGAVTLVSISGCRDDYLNNRDTIALSAGSAMRGNAVVHTIEPWPEVARKTHQDTDGRKAQNAVELYREKPQRKLQTSGKPVTTKK